MVDVAADKTIKALMSIVKSGQTQSHVLNEVAITLSEVLRKYPQKYKVENCVKIMIGKIESIQEPRSLAAIIWMLGEYGTENIKNCNETFIQITESFEDSDRVV